jgi:hypothetical protein
MDQTSQPLKFRKKPVVIEAIKLERYNYPEIYSWMGEPFNEGHRVEQDPQTMHISIYICTLEGYMKAEQGDWIIKGVAGEFYPCKPDIFDASYENWTTE